MLIVSGGLQKSGSALCFNIINDLLIENGYSDIRKIREEYELTDIIVADDCYLHQLNLDHFKRLLPILNSGKTFTVKTHLFPANDFFDFIRDNKLEFGIKFLYTYRDPRDVLVSAIEHHRRNPSDFQNFDTMEKSLIAMEGFCQQTIKWFNYEGVHTIQYEKFTNDLRYLIDEITKNIELQKVNDEHIINKYDKKHQDKWDDETKSFKRLHFNKAEIGRYKEFFKESEIFLIEK